MKQPSGRTHHAHIRTIVIGAVAVIAAITAWRFVFSEHGQGNSQGTIAAEPASVVVAPVTQDQARFSFDGIGRVLPREQVTVTAEASGRLANIAVAEGAYVDQGGLLLELEMRDEAAALAAAEARLQQDAARYRRDQELFAQGHIAQQRLDQSLAARDASKAQVEAAQVAVNNRRIVAPFAGRVGLIPLSVGDYVRPGDPLFSLVTDRLLEVAIAVPARLADQIAADAPVTLWPGQPNALTSRLATRDPAADPQTNTITLKALLDAPSGLTPGQSVAVTVLRGSRDNALFIPEKAVLMAGPQHYVFRVDKNNKARRQTVSIGLRRAGEVEIREGLDAKDQVIVEGVQKVDDGQAVSPQPVSTPAHGQAGTRP